MTRGYEENNLGTYLVSQKKHLKLQKICCTGWNYSKLKCLSADIFQISDTKQSCTAEHFQPNRQGFFKMKDEF